jgi:hypothetical protein
MRRLDLRFLGPLAALSAMLSAVAGAQPEVQGPISGFVTDGVTEVRPIYGIPGASQLGLAVALPFAARVIATAPIDDFALALTAAGEIVLATNLSGQPAIAVLGRDDGEFSRIAFSSSGAAAVLVSDSRKAIQTVYGLPARARLGARIELVDLADAIGPVAVDGSGLLLLAALQERAGNGQESLYRIKLDSATRLPERVAPLSRATAVLILGDGKYAAVADAGAGEVVLLHAVARTPVIAASFAEGIESPAFLAAAAGRLLVGSAVSKRITEIDPDALTVSRVIEVSTTPSGIHPLTGDTFLLSGADSRPLYVLDLSGEPRVTFVPAGNQ